MKIKTRNFHELDVDISQESYGCKHDPVSDKLVDSGAITEAQRQEIGKLPEPEGRTAQRVPREVQ